MFGEDVSAQEQPNPLQDQDAIDFTDNDINALSNLPLSPRLHTLLLARNRVNSIQPTLANSIPNLTTLVLTSNNVAELADLDPLRNFPRLTHLSLLENPVTRKEVWIIGRRSLRLLTAPTDLSIQHYRYWIIWRCPAVRFLDYQKVKDAERKKATELFGTTKEPSALASKVSLLLRADCIDFLGPAATDMTRLWASNPAHSTSPAHQCQTLMALHRMARIIELS